MAKTKDATEQDLLESIESTMNLRYGTSESKAKAKVRSAREQSLKEMQKKLPDWSLEPPSTFLPSN